MLGQRHVLPSVRSSLNELLVEGTFPSGTFLVAVDDPICSSDGNLENALYGSFLPIPSPDKFRDIGIHLYEKENLPGAVIAVKGKNIIMHEKRHRISLRITNNGDRPIQVDTTLLPQKPVLLILLKRLDRITLLLKQIPNLSSIE